MYLAHAVLANTTSNFRLTTTKIYATVAIAFSLFTAFIACVIVNAAPMRK